MFGIDFSEILVIFGIALVVLGPEKLPKLAQNIGRWIGRARAMARQFREQLEQEANTLRKDVDPNLDIDLNLRDPTPHGTSANGSAPVNPAAAYSAPVDPAPNANPDTKVYFDVASTASASTSTDKPADQPATPAADDHERGR